MTLLSKYLQFQCSAQTYGSDLESAKLAKAIKADCGLDAESDSDVGLFAMIYTCTDDVTFSLDGTERKPIRDFQKRWESLGKKPSPKALWEMRINLPHPIMTEWITSFNAGQSMFDVPTEQKPPDWLTTKEREEAQRNDSPLVELIASGK